MCLRSLVACVNCDGTLLSTCMKTGSLRSSMPVGQLLDLILTSSHCALSLRCVMRSRAPVPSRPGGEVD